MSATIENWKGHSVRTEMRIQLWRMRFYGAGFLLAYVLHLAANGFDRWPVFSLLSIISVTLGVASDRPRYLRTGIVIGIVHALMFPALDDAMKTGQAFAAVVSRDTIWPQLLVTLIGSRVLSSEGELSFARFWQNPLLRGPPVEMQSIPSAVALGAFLTLVFYLVAPQAITPGAKSAYSVIVSAMMGGTIVHSAIVFLFFVVLAAILESARLYVVDRSVINSFCRIIEQNRATRQGGDLAAVVATQLSASAHSRAVRLLNVAIEMNRNRTQSPGGLAAVSLDNFRSASRQFVRSLLPLLPLLGFLGTVIGLATAIGELPRGLTDGTGQGFDISASLAGLAVKFETTLLGLMASMISSLALNYLEKREAELAAECMLIVGSAGARDA